MSETLRIRVTHPATGETWTCDRVARSGADFEPPRHWAGGVYRYSPPPRTEYWQCQSDAGRAALVHARIAEHFHEMAVIDQLEQIENAARN